MYMKHIYPNLYFLILTKPVPAQVPVKASFSTSETIVTLYSHRSTNQLNRVCTTIFQPVCLRRKHQTNQFLVSIWVLANLFCNNYSPFPKRWNSKWSSKFEKWKSKSSMIISSGLFSKGSFEKRPELWPSRISIFIFQAAHHFHPFVLWFSSKEFVGSFAMKECEGGRRGCWADAAELPEVSFAEVLMMHTLGQRWKLLAVWRLSSALRRGALLFESGPIRGRASQTTRWQDVQYFQNFAHP